MITNLRLAENRKPIRGILLPMILAFLAVSNTLNYQSLAFQVSYQSKSSLHDFHRIRSLSAHAATESPSYCSTVPVQRNELEIVQEYTRLAIQERGNTTGLEALNELALLCHKRTPFSFSESKQEKNQDSVIEHLPSLLPDSSVAEIERLLIQIEENGWLASNPDSVDGLPSLHLNLISGGKPLHRTSVDAEKENDDLLAITDRLLELIMPHIENELLPKVNQLLNSTSISISEVFIRRYGQDICGDVTRNGISAHYDVFSRITSVIALDDCASQGANGLYTTYLAPPSSLKSTVGPTSNHASLRRFFPLESGDAVVHTWDVLHGVDVEPGLSRSSLIVWFSDTGNEDPTNSSPPWLRDRPDLETNHVVQFVLGSALSSIEGKDDTESKEVTTEEQKLYLKSAVQGNSFALTRMGSLFEEDAITNPDIFSQAKKSLEQIQKESELPDAVRTIPASTNIGLAVRYWFEGALQGNPLAQRALADELMFQAAQTGDEDGRIMAAVLFTLAAQQGCAGSLDSLSRVVEFDLASRGVETEEEFAASPVVQTTSAGILQ